MNNEATEAPQPIEVELKDLRLNDSNPRHITDGKMSKLIKSVKEFPQMLKLRPIVVNEDMVILGGNMRYRAAVEAGLKTVWVVIAEGLTEAQQLEFIIKDNVGLGEWDWDEIANEWSQLPLDEWGLDIPVPVEIEPEDEAEQTKAFKLTVSARDEAEQDEIYIRLLDLGYTVTKK